MPTPKKVAIIGVEGLPDGPDGFETLAACLVRHLHHEHELTVYCSGSKQPRAERRSHCESARLVYLPLPASGLWRVPYTWLALLHALFFADVLLVLGTAGGALLPVVRQLTGKRILVSLGNIEWQPEQQGRLAGWWLRWSESLAVRYAHATIASSDALQSYATRAYGIRSRVVEPGGEHASRPAVTAAHHEQYPFLAQPYAFQASRIDPENNVHVVLAAFAEMPGYPLVLAGDWHRSAYGRELHQQYAHYPNLHLLDPLRDRASLDVLRSNCLVYIHGHRAGTTTPALVEAMCLGLPVLAFDAPGSRAATEHQAHYFASQSELKQAISATRIGTWKVLGQQMRAVANRRYNWESTARQYGYFIGKAAELTQPGAGVGQHPQLSHLPAQQLAQYRLGQRVALSLFQAEAASTWQLAA